jgi:hypothetical protein
VRLNDVFFAAHASCINLLTLAQCAAYDRGSQRVHARTRTAFALAVPATAAYAAAVWLLPDAFPVLWCGGPRACRPALGLGLGPMLVRHGHVHGLAASAVMPPATAACAAAAWLVPSPFHCFGAGCHTPGAL